MTTSARQLDRDIRRSLTRSLRRWRSYGGGPTRRSAQRRWLRYERALPEGTYEIRPISSREGHLLGYDLFFAATEPEKVAWIPRGWRGLTIGMYSSPEEAAIAAADHYAEAF